MAAGGRGSLCAASRRAQAAAQVGGRRKCGSIPPLHAQAQRMAVGLVLFAIVRQAGGGGCCAGDRRCFDASWDEPLGQRSPVAAARSGSGVDAAPNSAGHARATGGTGEGEWHTVERRVSGCRLLEVGRKDARSSHGGLVTSSCFGSRCFDVPASQHACPPCLPPNQARQPPPAAPAAVATLSPVLRQPHTDVYCTAYSRHVLSVIPCSDRCEPPYCILARAAAHTSRSLSSPPALPAPCPPSRRSKPPRTFCPLSTIHRPVGPATECPRCLH